MSWNPGFVGREPESNGTERHTLPDAPVALEPSRSGVDEIEPPPPSAGAFEDFFSAGDEGRYEGGPATVEPIELELDEPPEPVVMRTPQMDARRAIFARGVAVALGCLVAVVAAGAVRQRVNAPRSAEASVAAVAAVAPMKQVAAPAAAKAAEPVVATPTKGEEPARVEPTETKERAVAKATPKLAVVAPPALPAAPAPAVKPAPAAPLTALPSVASFAAKTPIPATVRASVPTASFAMK